MNTAWQLPFQIVVNSLPPHYNALFVSDLFRLRKADSLSQIDFLMHHCE